ncbi:hypothetical protein HCCG_00280 [Helicobacter cinaedi CCUG 18818 = ATCC BAA-847]|uniref:Uncharacterized protein n=1 Tax=Helicobacter cinaedi CCUG 18818 = ATCC BAA-847 TaxID=537971 RepID=A0ABN0B8H7_9HELI|nr:hypothetical protein [Helicobacter cinaedi]EFR45734.1 hypothetical protein HCCG_00280 [Helicobacter cinaedi CCUG 18818 = ATCC BAA-847]
MPIIILYYLLTYLLESAPPMLKAGLMGYDKHHKEACLLYKYF